MKASRSPSMRRSIALLTGFLACFTASPVKARQAEPPPPLPAQPLEFPGFEEFTLENGLRVVVVSYGTQPVMSARLYVRGGRVAESSERAGTASLTATVLTRGTETRSAEEIAEEIEGVGGSLFASGGQDFFSVSAIAVTDHMETAFDLLADVVQNATFPQEEVELARRQMLSSLQAELGQAQSIAARRFLGIVYGDDHPYGRGATPETVEAITREDLHEFRDRLLRPEGALLLVAGRVDRDQIESRVRAYLSDWTGEAPPPPELPDAEEQSETRIYLVHRPGSVQSVVSIGHLGVTPSNPDYFALQVMNRVLGGGGDARLFQILREERGWTYGAYSQFTRPARRGHFAAQAEVRTEVTDSTVVEILHQIRRMRDEPVPEEELDGARSYLAGSFPLRLETADQVAGQVATTLLLDLPLESMTHYPDRVRAVTGEDVRRAAETYLHPDRAAIVVVGDGAELVEQLEAIAPLEFFDVRGARLTREDILGTGEVIAWDASKLSVGERRYEVTVQNTRMGTAEYRLERDGDDWVSTVVISSMGSSQETHLRFSADDFTPREVKQDMAQGPFQISAALTVEGGHLTGIVELPEQLGGTREYDQPLTPGTLFPGMDEYALSIADLEEGLRLTIPYLNLTDGEMVRLQAHVTGRQEVSVPAGTFDTWRVEVTGGDTPLTLHLRAESPHILVRQEFTGQPVVFELTGVTP